MANYKYLGLKQPGAEAGPWRYDPENAEASVAVGEEVELTDEQVKDGRAMGLNLRKVGDDGEPADQQEPSDQPAGEQSGAETPGGEGGGSGTQPEDKSSGTSRSSRNR